VCSADIPSCLSGQFVAPKSQWAGCCFDASRDCMEFDYYVVVTLSIPVEVATSTVAGTININYIRQALAAVTNVHSTDVGVLFVQNPVIQLSISPSTDFSKESNETKILESTINAVAKNPNMFLEALASVGLHIDSFGVVAYPSIAARTPTEIARFADFTDLDGRSGWVMGPLLVHRAVPTDVATTRFTLYFGDGKGTARENRVGDFVAAQNIDVSNSAPFVTINVPATQVPLTAKTWLAFSGGPFAESTMGYSLPLVETVRQIPGLVNGTVAFVDEDPRPGYIRGNVTIETSSPSEATSDYVVYFGTDGDNQDSKIGPAIGEAVAIHPATVVPIKTSLEVPRGATRILVFARNVDIEASNGISSPFTDLALTKRALVQ